MKIEKIKKGNIFSNMPSAIHNETFETLATGHSFRLERIVSGKGYSSPKGFWYDQSEDEWVIVLKGRALIRFSTGADDCHENAFQDVELGPGDYVFIPRHLKHRVESTSPAQETIWLALHFDGQ